MPQLGRFRLRVLYSTVAAIFLCACTRDAAPERVFTVRGVVRGAHNGSTISIEHEAIPNFMPAMTMPFYAEAAAADGLVPGDRVEFEFRVGEGSRATNFRKLGPVAAPDSWAGARTVTPRIRLRAGDAVPAFSLIDQDNRAVTEGDLAGRHTVLTFIFTRCPVPEFCPLIGKKFQALQAQLKRLPTATGEVRLLGISIDPEYDQPAVLRAYGEALGADFSRWRFATGTRQEIEKFTQLFAVRTERNDGALDHTLATALIAPHGKVVEIWRGNGWMPDEIMAKVESTMPASVDSALERRR